MWSELEDTATLSPQEPRVLVVDRVYDAVRKMLTTGQLEPGRTLNLDRLARELHVSNTPLRRALARLQEQGLVTREPNRGFAASTLLDVRTIAELYDFRLLLEPPAAGRAARRSSPDVVGRLEALIAPDEINRLAAEPRGSADLRERDLAFHSLIAEAAGNRVVACHLATALGTMVPYTLYHNPEATVLAWEEHGSVVDAIRSADPEAAAEAMRVHLANSRDRFGAVIESGPV